MQDLCSATRSIFDCDDFMVRHKSSPLHRRPPRRPPVTLYFTFYTAASSPRRPAPAPASAL